MGGATWYLGEETTWFLRRAALDQFAHIGTSILCNNIITALLSLDFPSICIVLSLRAIENLHREYCERNSKEQPEYMDSNPSDELMWTDSTVWAKVATLIIYLSLTVFTLINVLCVRII